jgi:hypothetical protein
VGDPLNLAHFQARRISRLPTPPMPPKAPPPGSARAASAASAPPGRCAKSPGILSAGPSVARKSRMIPTARSATGRSMPTLVTIRPTSSSMAPSRSLLPPAELKIILRTTAKVTQDRAENCRDVLQTHNACCRHASQRWLLLRRHTDQIGSRDMLLRTIKKPHARDDGGSALPAPAGWLGCAACSAASCDRRAGGATG